MNKRIERYMDMARKLSYFSDHSQHRLGAIVVYKNRVQGFGYNQCKTHPRSNNDFNRLHAEVSSILNCSRQNLVGCDIFVFRQCKDGSLGCSKPCKFCMEFIKKMGIKRVYYSDIDGYKELKV
jgi:deoxycytidylate deaminase